MNRLSFKNIKLLLHREHTQLLYKNLATLEHQNKRVKNRLQSSRFINMK